MLLFNVQIEKLGIKFIIWWHIPPFISCTINMMMLIYASIFTLVCGIHTGKNHLQKCLCSILSRNIHLGLWAPVCKYLWFVFLLSIFNQQIIVDFSLSQRKCHQHNTHVTVSIKKIFLLNTAQRFEQYIKWQ